MRKACSTRSLYSDGVNSPIMSVRLRMSVLRFRQLSMHRLYDRREHACNLDLPPLRQERAEAPLRVRELAPRPLRLAVLRPPTGGGQVTQSRHEFLLAEPCGLRQRCRRLAVFRPQQVPLRAPENALETRLRRRP